MPDSHNGPHWSTDYVEHIRTVHFTLIAVCVTLIVLSTSRSPSEVHTAHDQIKQIREFIGQGGERRERSVLFDWLDEGARMRVNEWANSESFYQSVKHVHPGEFRLLKREANTVEFLHNDLKWQAPLKFEGKGYYIWDWGKKSVNVSVDDVPDETQQRGVARSFHSRPESLDEFRILWDLAGHVFLDVPTALNSNAYFSDHDEAGSHNPAWEPITLSFTNVVPSPDDSSPKTEDVPPQLRVVPLQLRSLSQEQIKAWHTKDSSLTAKHFYIGKVTTSVKNSGSGNAFQTIRAPLVLIPIVDFASVYYDAQSLLISHTKKEWDWKHGTFDYSFHTLNNITKDYQGTISLEAAEQVLASEESRTGESFEALGIKFPAENTTRWGILVIIGIQIYFWIHLQELKPKLRRNDPGWDVAWVGVYPSTYARIAMFFLTCLLPLAAALTLGIRGLQISSYAKTTWALLIFGGVATSTFSALAWKRLPRTNESH